MALNKEQKKTALRNLAADAESDVVKAGLIQFRLDADAMRMLLKMAEHKRTPAGVLSRLWVIERMHDEYGKLASKGRNGYGWSERAQAQAGEATGIGYVRESSTLIQQRPKKRMRKQAG